MSQSLVTNQNYLVTITKGLGGNSGATVQANAAAKLNIRIDNKWINVLEAMGLGGGETSTFLGKLVSNAANTAQILTGDNFLPEIATSHVWRGSSGIDITLQLRFDAWDDTGKDVLAPVQKLIYLFAPYRENAANGGGIIPGAISAITGLSVGQLFLHPPGPTPWEYFNNQASDKTITVSLGRVMHITNLVPTTFEWEFEDRFATPGDPMCANVTVGFMSYTLPTRDDLLAFFVNRVFTGG